MKDIFVPRSVGRFYTRDAQAITFRMPAGFPGDVNRTHPMSIEPVTIDPTNPPAFYGQAGVIDGASHFVRSVLAGDTALTSIYGITVRPFPSQGTGLGSAFGAATIGSSSPISAVGKLDMLRSGYIMVTLNNFVAVPSVKGGAVFVWIAASAGVHVQGGFEAVASGTSTIPLALPNTSFNGGPDSGGVVELIFNA
jgi:hypothetical protein